MDDFELQGKENGYAIDMRSIIAFVLIAVVFCGLFLFVYFFFGEQVDQTYPVYINEILASNSSYPNEDGLCCDYIELYNSADYPVDLSGFMLGDVAGGNRYRIPSGTIMEPYSYLVIYCDSLVDQDYYAPFGISRSGGETFYLIGGSGAVVDKVVTIPSDMNQPMVRAQSGALVLSSIVTPGQDNAMSTSGIQDVYNDGISPVRITEISVTNNGYSSDYGIFCDWIELHNTGSDLVELSGFTLSDNMGNAKYVFPVGTFIDAGAYLIVYCSIDVDGETIAPFGLSKFGGETVVLKNPQGLVVEIVDTFPLESGSQILFESDSWVTSDNPSPGYPNTDDGYASFIQNIGAEPGVITISEVMPDSIALLPDSDGEFSDWIELYNSGANVVNLQGWCLSDDANDPKKWVFPDCEILPGERLIVFCSGKDAVLEGQVHTNFSLSSSGESLILTSYLGNAVDSVQFGKAQTNYSFVFDSGETRIIPATPGFSNDDDGYAAFCASSVPAGPLAIWEVMVSNDTYLPQQLGKCYDWVEIRNISNGPVNLSDYSITDDPDNPVLHTLENQILEAGECVVVMLSGDSTLGNRNYDHAAFTLNASQDQLLLYKNGELLVDYVYLKGILPQMSYGRDQNTGGFYYMEPSPLNPNTAGYRQISNMPQSSIAPGVYSSDKGLQVTLEADGVIYYTTDGSTPSASSAVYSEPIRVDQTQVLRAVAVEPGKLVSSVYTATFVIGQDHDLPVVSLVTDPDGLWGKDGVYVNGDLTVKEVGLSANVAYSGADGNFSVDCEMAMHGDTSLYAFDKKSFKIRFKDSYDGPLQYDLFEDGEVSIFSSLVLRAAHESTYSTHMHDTFIASVASESCDTVISMKYKYVALYLNGEYWGLYAFREHHSEEHYASYMNVPIDSVTMVRYTTDINSKLKNLYSFCSTYSLRQDKDYNWAKEVLDISSITDWTILQAYMCNVDINNNMRYYYSSVDGLWRCALVDLDLGMAGSHAAFSEVLGAWHHGEIPSALFANKEYKDYAAKRLAELLRGPLSDESTIARIKSMADSIREEVKKDAERWNYPVYGWEKFYRDMIDFCDGRAVKMINSFCAEVGFNKEQKNQYFGDLLK